MNKQYKIGDEVLVRGIVNSEVRNGGIHVLHDGVDAFYLLDQIHELQMVVVPAFIDSYIRYAKTEGMSLFIAMDNAQNKESEWIIANEKTFARAWLDGYEVEQEKLYVVTDGNKLYLKEFDELNAIIIIDDVVGVVDDAKRYEDKTKAQQAADELEWIVKEVE
ncbi:DUF1642 domain-containing protein [Streptococcus suis]|uniref:DUF1642 domain-containing protein n=1 Tax=Streptococcus suis TaxID=1307 RepID=UPI00129015D7|nr:DUF1642 domain-containing protein [Streptococcus suis]